MEPTSVPSELPMNFFGDVARKQGRTIEVTGQAHVVDDKG
jgi:hypothetical protein